jgi:hypothetical protein
MFAYKISKNVFVTRERSQKRHASLHLPRSPMQVRSHHQPRLVIALQKTQLHIDAGCSENLTKRDARAEPDIKRPFVANRREPPMILTNLVALHQEPTPPLQRRRRD